MRFTLSNHMETCHLDDKSLNVEGCNHCVIQRLFYHDSKSLSRPFLDRIQNSAIQYYEVIGGMGFDLGN